jgi:hypothetical protein
MEKKEACKKMERRYRNINTCTTGKIKIKIGEDFCFNISSVKQ